MNKDWEILNTNVWVVDHGLVRMGNIIEFNGDRVHLHLTDGSIKITTKDFVFLSRESIREHCEEMENFWGQKAREFR